MVFKSAEAAAEITATNVLSWILDSCTYDPNQPVLVDAHSPDKSLSWTQIKELVLKAAAGFHAIGVEKGDCVIFLLENSIYYYPLVYGCAAAGAVPSGLPPTGTLTDLRKSAVLADAKYFIVEPKLVNRALEVVHEMSLPESNIIVMDPVSQEKEFRSDRGTFKTWISLLEHGVGDWEHEYDLETAGQTVAMRFFTSGTLGVPKGVDLSHDGLLAHVAQWYNPFLSLPYKAKIVRYTSLSNITGYSMVTLVVKLGIPIYLMREVSITGFIEACNRFKPTIIQLDPGTALKLTKVLPTESQELRSIRDVRAVGDAFPGEVRQKLKSLLHPECLVSAPYGLTEVGTIAAVPSHSPEQDHKSVGFTWPGVQIKLVDDDGLEIHTHDTPGELCVKTSRMFLGYYKNPSATSKAFDKDGWFYTGDIGYMSFKTRQWYILGRRNASFYIDHREVFPIEIEALLISHPDILDAVVMSVRASENVSGKIKACVVPRVAGAITEEQILTFMAGKLEEHKTITGGVEFVENVPRNASGKIIRWKVA